MNTSTPYIEPDSATTGVTMVKNGSTDEQTPQLLPLDMQIYPDEEISFRDIENVLFRNLGLHLNDVARIILFVLAYDRVEISKMLVDEGIRKPGDLDKLIETIVEVQSLVKTNHAEGKIREAWLFDKFLDNQKRRLRLKRRYLRHLKFRKEMGSDL